MAVTHDDIVKIFTTHGIPIAPDDDPYYKQNSYTVSFVPRRQKQTEGEKKQNSGEQQGQ